MKLEVKQMYGLNGKEKFELNSTAKHNFIYGINASCKSSIANSITHLLKKIEYQGNFLDDSKDYQVKLNFDDIDIEYKTGVDINKIRDINRRVFVFNKRFINDSINDQTTEGEGTTPEIGIRVAERELLIKENNVLVEKNIKMIKKNFNSNHLPTTQKDLYRSSSLKKIFGTNKSSQQESYLKLRDLGEIKPMVGLTNVDFFEKNISIFETFESCLSKLTEEIVDRMQKEFEVSKYKITNKEDQEFYLSLIEYMKNLSGIINCPVCLMTEIDVIKLTHEVEAVLTKIINDSIIGEVSNLYQETRKIDSYFSCLITNIYEKILQCQFPLESINSYIHDLKEFTTNYDSYFVNFSKVDFDINTLEVIEKNNKIIDEINNQNQEITNIAFVEQFDKFLTYIFTDDDIKLTTLIKDNTIEIKLTIRDKDAKNIETFFNIISESQKTKLSLAFFFALVVYKKESNDILCIFDDPIDSYDSISKYKIARILNEFITQKNIFESYSYNCHSIFLSHSIEYFRLYRYYFNKEEKNNNNYYILSKGKLTEINYNKLYVIEGDYKILNNLIANKNHKIRVNEIISVIPIIRELSSYSDKNFNIPDGNLKIKDADISSLNNYLSKNIIHGFNNNIKLKDLIDTLKNYMKFDLQLESISLDTSVFTIMESLIIESRESSLDFYNQLVTKNLIAIYVRAFYDYILLKIIKSDVPKYANETIDNLKSNSKLWFITQKINTIRKCTEAWKKYKDVCIDISMDITMLNDFAHSAGIYLTPLIDVDLDELYKIFEKITVNNSIFEPIVKQ